MEKFLSNIKALVDRFSEPLPMIEWHGLDDQKYENNQLTIEYVGLHGSHFKPGRKQRNNSLEKDLCNQLKEMKKENDEEKFNKNTVMCFIVRLKRQDRKIDVHKLMQLNTEIGPWIKKLVQGEDVILNGKVIKPEHVMIKSELPNGPIVVLDCPTEGYIDSLVTNKQLLDLQEQGEQPVIIIHMAPAAVIADPRYKAFMDRHKTETVHLMMNENSHGPYLHQTQKLHTILNKVHPGIFPALHGYQHNKKNEPATDNIVQACHSLSYTVLPEKSRGFNWDNLLCFDVNKHFQDVKKQAVKDAYTMVKYTDSETKAKQLMNFKTSDIDNQMSKLKYELQRREKVRNKEGKQQEYPEIVFLGTGSGRASLHRNFSCILLQIRKDEYFILDCGEGTLLQMYQMYGLEKTNHILRNLKGVFVSHLHLDHHGGLIGILEAHQKEISKHGRNYELTIFGPSALNRWLNGCSKYTTSVSNTFRFMPHHMMYNSFKSAPDSDILREARALLGLSEIIMVPVEHSYMAFGICMQHEDGWKLVYSGDTLPSSLLAHFGKDCDILIHEGTFHCNEETSARMKKHSTIDNAIQVGKDMNAKFTLVTHFSQRYSKIPVLPEKCAENVGFAFDFMQIRPDQLSEIPLVMPVLNKIFGYNEAYAVRKLKMKASAPKTMFKKDFWEMEEEEQEYVQKNKEKEPYKNESKEAGDHFRQFYFNK